MGCTCASWLGSNVLKELQLAFNEEDAPVTTGASVRGAGSKRSPLMYGWDDPTVLLVVALAAASVSDDALKFPSMIGCCSNDGGAAATNPALAVAVVAIEGVEPELWK